MLRALKIPSDWKLFEYFSNEYFSDVLENDTYLYSPTILKDRAI